MPTTIDDCRLSLQNGRIFLYEEIVLKINLLINQNFVFCWDNDELNLNSYDLTKVPAKFHGL